MSSSSALDKDGAELRVGDVVRWISPFHGPLSLDRVVEVGAVFTDPSGVTTTKVRLGRFGWTRSDRVRIEDDG